MVHDKKLGVSLSGGGYRAAAFHLGTLRALHELGLLASVDVLSTISGGSIAGAYYLLHKDDFAVFEAGLKKGLKQSVIQRIILAPVMLLLYIALLAIIGVTGYAAYCATHNVWIGIGAGLLGLLFTVIIVFLFQFFFLPFTSLKIKAYDKLFFNNRVLDNLPESPRAAINASNLETGTLMTFSRDRISDSSYNYPKDRGTPITFTSTGFPLSWAVAASTCVPVPFPPVHIPGKYFANKKDISRISPALSDGGLYDNQGIHKLTERNSSYCCDIVICSDGSQPFSFRFRGKNSVSVLYRANDIMMRKIKSLQFIRDVYGKQFEIAYFSLDWQYDLCIKGFVDAIESGRIQPGVLAYHNITGIDFNGMTESIRNETKQLLRQQVKEKIHFDSLIATGLSTDEINQMSLIATGLSAFNEDRIELLARHAYTLTRLQLKLYCPTLAQQA